MLKPIKTLLLATSILLLSSCAGKYALIKPAETNFTSRGKEKINFSYKYEVLKIAGNRKYVKKEGKKGIRLVALKISNHTPDSITFQKDFTILADYNEVDILPTKTVYDELKQIVPLYLLYLLLTPTTLSKTETRNGITTSENIFPIGLIIGPGIAAGNMIAAGSANSKFEEELRKHELHNKTIAPGETAYALIGIREAGFRPLHLKTIK